MRHTKSEYSVKSDARVMPHHDTLSSDFERDEVDSLNIRSLSITFLGITITFLTIVLPSTIVLLGRPVSQGNEIIFNHSVNKDGS